MVSRKLNVLLYAFTGEAETLQSGSSGICPVIAGFYTVVAFRMFELVAAIQICIQNWKTFPMIFTRKRNKIKHRIEHSQKTIS